MTKEQKQAIECLKADIKYWENTSVSTDHLIMAIKALEQQPSEDCVSREGARQFLYEEIDRLNNDELYDIFSKIIDDMYNELPSVTPTHGACKDCEHWNGYRYCTWIGTQTEADFYCKDFEKRGDSGVSNKR